MSRHLTITTTTFSYRPMHRLNVMVRSPAALVTHRPHRQVHTRAGAAPEPRALCAPPLHPRLRVTVCDTGAEKRHTRQLLSPSPIHRREAAREYAQRGGRGGCSVIGRRRPRLRPPGEDWRRLGLHLCCSGSRAAPRLRDRICWRRRRKLPAGGDHLEYAVPEASDFLIGARR